MPYIDKDAKEDLEDPAALAKNSGELNYLLTMAIKRYLAHHELSYQTCNDIVGALENCKHEFQRRVQDPYENDKLLTNGDVYR